MDKEEMAMSHESTLGSTDHPKTLHAHEDSSSALNKRQPSDLTEEFDQLIRSVSDSGSDNHCEQPPAQQDAEDQEAIGIGRKRLVRNRTAVKTKPPVVQEPRDQKCANPNCLFVSKKEAGKLVKVKNAEYIGLFCAKCVDAIEKKWSCSFCRAIYTDDQRSAQADSKTWIECENKACGKWTHLDCEQDHRRQEDLTMCIKDSKQKFFCSECFDSCKETPPPAETLPVASKKKSETLPCNLAAEQGPQQASDPNAISDLRSCLKPCSKFDQLTNQQFFYLYSENYQLVAKLVNEKCKPLLLSEQEQSQDFEAIFKSTSDPRLCFAAFGGGACEKGPSRKKLYRPVMDQKPAYPQ